MRRTLAAVIAALTLTLAASGVTPVAASAACTQGPGCDSGWHYVKTYWTNTVCSDGKTNNAYVATNLRVIWKANDDRTIYFSGSEECNDGVAWGNLTRVIIKGNANCSGCTFSTLLDTSTPPVRGYYGTFSYHPAYPRNGHTYTMYGYFGTHLGYVTVFN